MCQLVHFCSAPAVHFYSAIDTLLVLADEKHSQDEPRYHALGKTNDTRMLHITFTLRAKGTLIRVISARDMHRKERKVYEQS